MRFENIELTGSITFTGSFIVPLGAPSNRESSPTTGSLFYNTDTKVLESYNGNQWVSQSSGGGDTPAGAEVEYLVVAGGGGMGNSEGYSYYGGGGGGGGLLSSSFSSLTSGSSYTITVGAGGAAGGAVNVPGNDGGNSSISGTGITTVTATGGGGGGDNEDAGRDGGSGGGAGGNDTGASGGSGTTGQGNDGGDTAAGSGEAGAGGGGAGGAGISNNTPDINGKNGGLALASSITGTSTNYAGGGGGQRGYIGSHGDYGSTGAGSNTGFGGNAQSGESTGDSGVVILAYPTSSYSATGGVRTTRSDGYAVHTFNSSGTLSVGGSGEMGDGVADFFGDGSNIFTLDITTGSLGDNSLEGGFTLRGYENRGNRRDGVVVFSNSVPTGRTGWGRSMTLSDNQDDISLTLDYPSTYTNPHNDVKAYCFWVYVDAHDDDDNVVLGVNLRRQSNGSMFVYAYGSSNTNDTFSTVSVDTWHHICVVDEGTTMRTYLNGSSLGTHSIGSNTLLVQAEPAAGSALGTDGSSRERGFIQISDANASNEVFVTGVRIFNRSLTAAEVTMLYNENP